MKGYIRKVLKKVLLANFFIILIILFLICGASYSQFPFYNPFYYPYPNPYLSFYPSPLYANVYFPPILPYNNPVFFNPAPAIPLSINPPAITPYPVASVSALTTFAPATVTTTLGVIIADILINTGNPQVAAVLNLIWVDPTLLDNPLLLDSFINTGNPDVASALTWLISAI